MNSIVSDLTADGKTQGIPKGWQLVPKELTGAMDDAFRAAFPRRVNADHPNDRDEPRYNALGDHTQLLDELWAALLSAAPPPPVAESGWQGPTVDETLDFITQAHHGQVDKIGEPYWKHPARVMARIPNATDHERIVALLHDVLEDTNYTALDLLKMGYPFDVVWDVNTLTKPKNAVPYRHRIATIAALGSPAAIRVKIADIEDNLDPPRFSKLQEQDQHRLGAKYNGAIEVLRAALPAPPHIADQREKP